MCPTNWGMSPVNAAKWVADAMIPYYPLGVYKDRGGDGERAAGGIEPRKEPAVREKVR